MKHAYTLIPFLVVVISCATQPKQTGPEAILIQMRADTSWIHHLDSLAQTAIGPGAKCLDKEEFTDSILESLEEDGFTVFRRDEKEEVLTVFARSRRGSPRLAHGTDQAGSRGQLRADGLRRVPHPPGGQGPARRQGQVHRGIPTDRSQILKEPCT